MVEKDNTETNTGVTGQHSTSDRDLATANNRFGDLLEVNINEEFDVADVAGINHARISDENWEDRESVSWTTLSIDQQW
jgi:hypothetical protein